MKTSKKAAAGARVICPGRTYQKPKVSIVTPTYRRNAEGLLARCLDSAMAQTFEDFELIVIDDGSSDGSEFTIRDAAFRDDRIVYVRHDTNCGIPAMRTNEGVMRARGEAVAFLFDDNIYRPDFIAAAWEALERSGADVVHSNVHMLAKQGDDFTLGGWPLTLELLRNLNTVPNGGVLVRRSFFDRYGLYDPHLLMQRVCDWDLWLRALALGAKFCHLDQISAVEHGLVSENSIGNTVKWDVKVAYAYMLDEARFAERSRRLTPREIGNYDCLSPEPVRCYVRSAPEWADLVETVYAPFLGRHGAKGFDPALPGNRAASLDPTDGWNAEWSVIGNRRRYLVVSNSINAWASAWLHALRREPGAIVINCPEWQLAAFRPADIDILVLLDCASAFIKSQLDAFRAAFVPILYVMGYGGQSSNAVPMALANRHFAHNRHIADLLGPAFYFPQAGVGFGPDQREGARILAADAYAVIATDADADRLGMIDTMPFPFKSVVQPAAPMDATGTRIVTYGVGLSDSLDGDEVVTLPNSAHRLHDDTCIRPSSEGLGALAESRAGARILVDADVLEATPLAERVGLAAISRRHAVTFTADDSQSNVSWPESGLDTAATSDAWQEWIANAARASQVARYFARARNTPAVRPNVGIFLNSEMFSGSEIYGLTIARSLQGAGMRARVFVPEISEYGSDSDVGPLNRWLERNGIPPVSNAPYRAGAGYLADTPAERSARLGRLEAFIADQQVDILICAGFMPLFADLSRSRRLLFMTLFQPSAYDQRQLAYLRGRLSGLISDSRWSLAAHQRVIGGPSSIFRPTIPIATTSSTPMKVPRTSGAIRIAVGGTLQPRKRQLEAIRATAILRDRGLPVALNLYGYKLAMLHEHLDEIAQTIADANLHGVVLCHGLAAPHEMARDNDIVLSASIDESLPQTLVEMMHFGLIGVAGLSGGIDELIEDGRTGYLTDDLSPHGLASALARAIADRARWPQVAASARAQIEQDHSIASNTGSLLSLLIEGAQIESTPFGRLARVPG